MGCKPPIMRLSTILVVLLALSTLACTGDGPTETFAGFTFGGGGKTYSCQPAQFEVSKSGVAQLMAGSSNDTTRLLMKWKNDEGKLGEQIELTEAKFTVIDVVDESELKQGTMVVQAVDGSIVHGSFDLTVSSSDGRDFEIRGSFTATQPLPSSR